MPLIERRSLAVEVAAQIQDEILKGTYTLNQQLPIEQKLMDNFGVGRSTIREAVKILVNSGYLRVLQGIGTFVEDNTGGNDNLFQLIKRSSSEDIAEVRRLLEMKIAEKAAQNRTGNDISKMEHYLDKRNKAAVDKLLEDYADAHIKFYQVMASASKNRMLNDLYKSFTKELKAELMNKSVEDILIANPTDLHYKLLDSIIRQDPPRAWYWSAKIAGQVT